MTTITIDMPLKLRRTHFSDALEAGDFLLRFVSSQLKKQTTTLIRKSQYQSAMLDLENNNNIISLSSYMQKRGLTK